MIGRIWPYKGVEYFLHAASIVEKEYPQARFVIAGEGDFTPYRRLAGRVTNLTLINRFLTEPEIAALLQGATVCASPYVSGSQTGWISAAYAFKKPVIASTTGNFPEMVKDGNTGIIVPPRDAPALARAILKILGDRALARELGNNGYEMMRRDMSWETVAQKTIDVYRETVYKRAPNTDKGQHHAGQ